MHSLNSTTNSLTSTAEAMEEIGVTPGIVDVKRLAKLKADQESRLKLLRARVDRLSTQERRVWKDVTWTQQMSLQADESRWRRQAQQADEKRLEREQVSEQQALRERARAQRLTTEAKGNPRMRKFEENKRMGQQVREEREQVLAHREAIRTSSVQSKVQQVESRRHERRQQQLRKDLEQARSDAQRQEHNIFKYAELQAEIQSAELAIAAAEHEEMSAVQRLQNSQIVRADVLSHLQEERPIAENGYDEEQLAERKGQRYLAGGAAGAGSASATSSHHRNVGGLHGTNSMLSSAGSSGLGQITEERQEEEHSGEHIQSPLDDGSSDQATAVALALQRCQLLQQQLQPARGVAGEQLHSSPVAARRPAPHAAWEPPMPDAHDGDSSSNAAEEQEAAEDGENDRGHHANAESTNVRSWTVL